MEPLTFRIGAVVEASPVAFGRAFADQAPAGTVYRGMVVGRDEDDDNGVAEGRRVWRVLYDDDDTVCAVKVWLDLAPRQPSLLCTLRPEKCEQVPIGLTLGRTQGDNYYTLRMEVVHRHKRKRDKERTAESYFKVHIIGTCLAVQTFEEEEMEGEACPLPHKH